MARIVGMPVTLYVKTETGRDALNNPVYELSPVTVENVLVGQPTTDEATDALNLYGKKLEYMLGVPKGDAHDWTDTQVEFFGKRFRTFGAPIQGIEANLPRQLPWHRKVRVERYG